MATINGNEGNDLNLLGTLDDDLINGFGGSDNLDGLAGEDKLDGGSGTDTLLGGDGEDTLLGGSGADFLNGGGGNDTLIGGAGSDTITSGAGFNTYVYNNILEGGDILTDFEPNSTSFDDTIAVSASGFGGNLTAGGFIKEAEFTLGTAATDSTDRFIYDQATGGLFFDVDGTGGLNQRLVATLQGAPTGFSHTDILVM